MSGGVHFLVLCVPDSVDYLRRIAERRNGWKTGHHGIPLFRICLRHRLRHLLRSTAHHSRIYRPCPRLWNHSLQLLQVISPPSILIWDATKIVECRCRWMSGWFEIKWWCFVQKKWFGLSGVAAVDRGVDWCHFACLSGLRCLSFCLLHHSFYRGKLRFIDRHHFYIQGTHSYSFDLIFQIRSCSLSFENKQPFSTCRALSMSTPISKPNTSSEIACSNNEILWNEIEHVDSF